MNVPDWLVRRITYPAHEWLRGRRTLRELQDLQRLAAQTPASLQRDTNERLRALLLFATARLPYYASLFSRCRVDPYARDLQAELRKLPVLDKPTVRKHAKYLAWSDVPGGPRPHSSGGTTGDTLHFVIDRVRQAQDLAARLFMQSLFGVRLGDRRLHLWGSPIETRAQRLKRCRDWLLNERLLDAFDLSPARLDKHLARLRSFRPQVVYGYPTAVALLAAHAGRARGPQGFPWLRLVVLTGEEVADTHVAQIRQVFGCAVASEYGNREVGLIAHACPRGRLHVITPHVYVEIGAGQHAGRGDILCTTLNTRAQPFIRYRVGDVGGLLAEPCPCGLPLPTMRLAGGKITGFIALPAGRLCHGAVTSHVLRDQPGIRAFKTYQHTLSDFEVLLVVDEGFRRESIERIRQRYRALFGAGIRVQCRLVDGIPPDPSGKRRYVVSSVSSERPEPW
jgi:phenylacetate-CoA ligase